MEVCFTFQWGWFVFQIGGAGGFIYKSVCVVAGGVCYRRRPWFWCRGRLEKNRRRRGVPAPSMPPTTMGNLVCSY